MDGRAIVFDLDGTLIDSLPAVRHALNRILIEDGRQPLTLPETRKLIGKGARVTIERAWSATGAPASIEAMENLTRRYISAYLESSTAYTVIFPDVLQVLERLARNGYPLGICTNKPHATTGPVLDALGLSPFFASIACGDSLPYQKPDGRHLLHVLGDLHARPEASVLIGDSAIDMAAARDARVPAIAVIWGYADIDPMTLDADARIGRFAELPAVIEHMFGTRLAA